MAFISTAKKPKKRGKPPVSNAMQVSNALSRLAVQRRVIDELNARLKKEKQKEDELESEALAALHGANMRSAKLSDGKLASIQERKHLNLEDWNKFVAFVKKTNGFDLMQRRVSMEAWKQRVEAGVRVPGVSVFTEQTVSIRGNKASAKQQEKTK